MSFPRLGEANALLAHQSSSCSVSRNGLGEANALLAQETSSGSVSRSGLGEANALLAPETSSGSVSGPGHGEADELLAHQTISCIGIDRAHFDLIKRSIKILESIIDDDHNNNNSRKSLGHQPTRRSRLERLLCTCSCAVGKKQVPFSMAIGNVELLHECSPKHLRMGTARIK